MSNGTFDSLQITPGVNAPLTETYVSPGVQGAITPQGQINQGFADFYGSAGYGGGVAAAELYPQSFAGTGKMAAGPVDNAAGSTPASDPSLFGGLGTFFGNLMTGGAVSAGQTAATMGAQAGSAFAGQGQQFAIGLQQGLLGAITTWIQGIGSSLTGWVTRGFLIIIGVVVIAVALVHVMGGSVTQVVQKASKLP